MSNRLEGIKERLQAAQYAARCAQGGGAFGVVEQGMLEEFQGAAQSDVAWLLEENERLANRISDEDLATLVRLGRELASQDNAFTAHPIFCVEQRRRTYGFDPEYTDSVVWIDAEGVEAEGAEADAFEAAYDAGDATYTNPDGDTIDVSEWTRTGYEDTWEHVTSFFTRAAADEYIERNKHRLRGPRVYADTAYRNEEWKRMRALFVRMAERNEVTL